MKPIQSFLLFMTAVVLLAGPLFPCIINFKPEKVLVERGKPVTVKLLVELEHRRCPLPLEDTELEGDQVEIIEQGSWTKRSRNLYEIELTLVLKAEEGELRVIRECEKKGISEGTLKVAAR
jgi:hypothetical protein